MYSLCDDWKQYTLNKNVLNSAIDVLINVN